jgi:hypothetical protein
MSSEFEDLLRAVSYEPAEGQDITEMLMRGYPVGQGTSNAPSTERNSKRTESDVASTAVEISRLVQIAEASTVSAPQSTSRPQSSSSKDTNVAETVFKTAEMVTGVGPIVTGLMKLFGSRDPEPLPELEKFTMPTPVSVEAGLSADRGYSSVRYAQGGRPQLAESAPNMNRDANQPSTIQVNIQAMDSQSFLDRQDDIARAVREAMLHSNSLNDIVMEL